MKFKLTDEDVFPLGVKYPPPDAYKDRVVVKAIVVNENNEYGFVTSPVHGYVHLPGGGAESDDLEKEILRECDEELNTLIKVRGKVGESVEYRNRFAQKYLVTCFFAEAVKELPEDKRTEDEKNNDLKPIWLSKEEAIKTIQQQVEEVKRGEVAFYNMVFNIVHDEEFFMEYIRKFDT